MRLASTPANSVPTAGTEKNNPEYGDKISMKLLIVEDDRTLNDGIALSLRAEADQILQACTLAEAKSLHDELEEYYRDAMDFDKVDQVAQKTVDQLLALV